VTQAESLAQTGNEKVDATAQGILKRIKAYAAALEPVAEEFEAGVVSSAYLGNTMLKQANQESTFERVSLESHEMRTIGDKVIRTVTQKTRMRDEDKRAATSKSSSASGEAEEKASS
jgi:hypothetical protein